MRALIWDRTFCLIDTVFIYFGFSNYVWNKWSFSWRLSPFCFPVQTADSAPLPVHTPTLRKKGGPGSTGFPPKVFHLFQAQCDTSKHENRFLLLCVIPVIVILISSKLRKKKKRPWKENKFSLSRNKHRW